MDNGERNPLGEFGKNQFILDGEKTLDPRETEGERTVKTEENRDPIDVFNRIRGVYCCSRNAMQLKWSLRVKDCVPYNDRLQPV